MVFLGYMGGIMKKLLFLICFAASLQGNNTTDVVPYTTGMELALPESIMESAAQGATSLVASAINDGSFCMFLLVEGIYLASSGCSDATCLAQEASTFVTTATESCAYAIGQKLDSVLFVQPSAPSSTGSMRFIIKNGAIALVCSLIPLMYIQDPVYSSILYAISLKRMAVAAQELFHNLKSTPAQAPAQQTGIFLKLKKPLVAAIAIVGGTISAACLMSKSTFLKTISSFKKAMTYDSVLKYLTQ